VKIKLKPRIESLAEKKLVGLSIRMSLTRNTTGQLWGRFGPKIKEITNRVTADKISMQLYDAAYYAEFSPSNEFEKWAAVEVHDFEKIPDGLKAFTLEGGRYAVFDYKGSSADTAIFQYIFWEWLPNDPNSEEEIWIPIAKKNSNS